MSNSGQEPVVTDERDLPCPISQEPGDQDPVPQQLKEVIDLVNSVNRRIEDCAVEWQAKISQAQWRILDSKPVNSKPWEQSVLARTYFTDKGLDYAFQGLLTYNKTFTDHLQNFVALLRGEKPTMIVKRTCNAQNQCSDLQEEKEPSAHSILPPALDLSVLEDTDTSKSKQIFDLALTTAQQSFTDLIKAKIDFDTKFLGFEATLNGAAQASLDDPSMCLCHLCSNVLGSAVTKGRNVKSIGLDKRRTRRGGKTKRKRLVKPKKSTHKGKARKRSFSLSRFSDQSAVTTGRSFKAPIMH